MVIVVWAAFGDAATSSFCDAGQYSSASLRVNLPRPESISFFKKKHPGKSASGEKHAVRKKNTGRLVTWLVTKLSSAAASIIRVADRFKIITFFRTHGKRLLFLGVCILIIVSAFSFYRGRYEGKRFMTTTRLSIMDKEVQRACRYIEDNFHDPQLCLSSISTVLVTGEAFLEALFEKELGLTLDAFVNQVRINRVKIMLRRTPSIENRLLAQSAGYRDEEVMRRVFEQVCGCSIDAYRRTISECGHA